MPIPVLMYHQIDAPAPRGTPLRGLTVSPAAFGRQMALAHALGYRGLCMADLEPYLAGRSTGKVFGITFDDGYANNLEHALPVLQRHRFSATVYAVAHAIGGSNNWDHAKGVAPKPLMTTAQLRAWVAAGQEVGSHGSDHVDLTSLDDTDALQQIQGSKAHLEDVLGAPVLQFCYPYGRYASRHAGMVQEAGYVAATTTRRSRVPGPVAGAQKFELPRVPVWGATVLPAFWLKLATAYEDRKSAAA